MKNLIRTYGVTSTRNHHFQYPDKYCDYILTDSEIKVKEFTVLPDEVSDHLALLLEWEE
jgi:endonuclease/exonuclease/phosphatase family metal-dependent hydrolase